MNRSEKAAAAMVLTALAAGWAALALILSGGSPNGLIPWGLISLGAAGSAAGTLWGWNFRPPAIRYVGIVGFALASAVAAFAALLIYRA